VVGLGDTDVSSDQQCSGSESGSTGSTCFWASRIRILLSSSKNSKKNLDSYYIVTSFGLLSFIDKNWSKIVLFENIWRVAGRAEDSCSSGPQQKQEGNIVSLIVSGKNTIFVVLFYTCIWHRFVSEEKIWKLDFFCIHSIIVVNFYAFGAYLKTLFLKSRRNGTGTLYFFNF
jgi:hypothetical protein